jgi:ankyrin repeat protein
MLFLLQTNGNAPLKRASQNGYTECCVLCLKAGAEPNHVNKQGETALHYSAKNNHFDCVKALVQGGCDWTVANPDGYVRGTAADCELQPASPFCALTMQRPVLPEL